MDLKELTKAEEQIMQILWEMEEGFVKEIIEHLPEPKPAYNTVSTVVRILEQKGFVAHKAFGKSHQYYTVVSKKDYTAFYMRGMVKNYFGNSFKNMLSFFAKEDNLDISELDEIMKAVKDDLKEK